MQQNNSDAQ